MNQGDFIAMGVAGFSQRLVMATPVMVADQLWAKPGYGKAGYGRMTGTLWDPLWNAVGGTPFSPVFLLLARRSFNDPVVTVLCSIMLTM
jgi:hypothetical protein